MATEARTDRVVAATSVFRRAASSMPAAVVIVSALVSTAQAWPLTARSLVINPVVAIGVFITPMGITCFRIMSFMGIKTRFRSPWTGRSTLRSAVMARFGVIITLMPSLPGQCILNWAFCIILWVEVIGAEFDEQFITQPAVSTLVRRVGTWFRDITVRQTKVVILVCAVIRRGCRALTPGQPMITRCLAVVVMGSLLQSGTRPVL